MASTKQFFPHGYVPQNSGVVYRNPHRDGFSYSTGRKLGCMDGTTFVETIELSILGKPAPYSSLGAITRSGA